MNKWVTGLLVLFAGAIGGPVLKMLYDTYTNTTTGILVTGGVDEPSRAIFMAIPWLAPAICFIITIIIWSRPGDPSNKRQ